MTVENTNPAPEQVEEVEVDVQEDAVVEASQQPEESSDAELDTYTKTVSKRINKKNKFLEQLKELEKLMCRV